MSRLPIPSILIATFVGWDQQAQEQGAIADPELYQFIEANKDGVY